MRKLGLLAIGVALCTCAVGRAADPPGDGAAKSVESRLYDTASCPVNSLAARTAAIDMLGTRGAQDSKLAAAIKPLLCKLLKAPPKPGDPERNYFLLHVIQAFGQLGREAQDALPDLAEIKGQDSTLDSAIDGAVKAILKPPAAAQDQPVKPPPPPPAQGADALITLLGEDDKAKADVLSRIIAAKALGPMAPALTNDQRTRAKDAATKAKANADKDLQCVAGNLLDQLK